MRITPIEFSHYTPYLKGTGLVSVFCLLSFFAASTVLGGNVFFNHFPALSNRAMIATRSPEMIFTSLKVGAGLHRGAAVKGRCKLVVAQVSALSNIP